MAQIQQPFDSTGAIEPHIRRSADRMKYATGNNMIDEIHKAICGKTVFLTGHTGFKGSWMTLWLNRLGARVVGYSLEPPTTPSLFEVCRIESLLDGHVLGDIRDSDLVRNTMNQAQPDFVFHFAAQTIVKTGYQSPRETFDVNVTGTASVLDAVASLGRPCAVVCVTSDKCYANDGKSSAFVESDHMGERDPYGASKGCAELVVRAYTHSFFHPSRLKEHRIAIASARAGNVIAGGDWTPYALVPDLVEAAKSDGTILLRNPSATRPWQHVLQTLSGYLLLATRLESAPEKYCGGWNFGPDEAETRSVAEFAEVFFKTWGQGRWANGSQTGQLHESQSLKLSIAKAREQLQWSPVWNMQRTVDMCVAWYKQYMRGSSPVEIGHEQIRQFEIDAKQRYQRITSS